MATRAMRNTRALLLVLGLSIAHTAPASAQELGCVPTPRGTYSSLHDLGLLGTLSVVEVRVSTGATCDPATRVGSTYVTLSTPGHTLTDDGVFVAVLGHRVARRDWDILHVDVFGPGGGSASLTLDDLPALHDLHGTLRVSLTDAGVRFVARDGEVTVTFSELAALARVDTE